MLPHVPKITIQEIAQKTGRKRGDVAKEKFMAELIVCGSILVISLIIAIVVL